MKFTFLSFILLFQIQVLAQIPNGGFENWTDLEPFTHPESDYEFSSNNEGLFYSTGHLGVSEVPGAEGSGMAVRTFLIGSDTVVSLAVFGNVPQGSELIFSDGVTVPESVPDSIRFLSRFEIDDQHPGRVFFQFFDDEELVTIGSAQDSLHIIPISGIQENWDTLTIDLALLEFSSDPNECVIGFSSSDVFAAEGSPGDYLEIDQLELFHAEDTLSISDFDEWAFVESPVQVDDWQSFYNPASGSVFRSEDSSQGNYSLGLLSQAVDSNVIQSSAFLAESSNFGINPNIPLPEGAFKLQFEYKYFTQSTDSGRAHLLLAEDSAPETLDIVTQKKVLHETDEWTEVSIDIDHLSSNANFFGVEFFSGPQYPGEPADSSILLIDKVKLLSVEQCGFDLQINEIDSTYCPDEEVFFSTVFSDSYNWYVKEAASSGFSLASDTMEFTTSFSEAGSYEYFVIAEQNSCFQSSDTLSFSIIELQTPTLTAGGLETISMCPNSEIELSVSNATNFSLFNWLLNNEILTTSVEGSLLILGSEGHTGTYSVESTSSECPAQTLSSNQVFIDTYPSNTPEVSQIGNTLNTLPAESYSWYLENQVIPGAISQNYTPLNDGNYNVEITDEFGCTYLSESFFYSSISIESILEPTWRIYPNPVQDILNIECIGDCGNLELLTSLGQTVQSNYEPNTDKKQLNTKNLKPGLYFLRNNENFVSPIIISR